MNKDFIDFYTNWIDNVLCLVWWIYYIFSPCIRGSQKIKPSSSLTPSSRLFTISSLPMNSSIYKCSGGAGSCRRPFSWSHRCPSPLQGIWWASWPFTQRANHGELSYLRPHWWNLADYSRNRIGDSGNRQMGLALNHRFDGQPVLGWGMRHALLDDDCRCSGYGRRIQSLLQISSNYNKRTMIRF